MESTFDQVVDSYHRARQSGELFDTFYRLFLKKAPEIPGMFAKTDFPHQKLMLRQSILEMLVFAQTEASRGEIDRLGERHRLLNVKPIHYDLWLDALCEALLKHDPAFNADLEALWRRSMQKGIDIMVAAPTPADMPQQNT